MSTNAADPCTGGINISGIPGTQLSYAYAQSTSGTYYWRVFANAGTGMPAVGSAIRSFIINSPPTASALVLRNSLSTVVSWDVGNRGHSCMTGLATNPRREIYTTTLTDSDGWADITSAQLQWNGHVYPMTLSGGSGNTVTATATVDLLAGDNGTTAQPINIRLVDSMSDSGYVASGYLFKAWSCNVPVAGNMYDSSDQAFGAVCSTGAGFTTQAGANMNFISVGVTQMPSTSFVVPVTGISDYASNFSWGNTYQVRPNSDLMGSNVQTRWIDLGVGTTSCGLSQSLTSAVIDPYSVNPSLKVDFSAIRNQDPWFQVVGGGILAGNSISNMVPVTCANSPATCTPASTIESVVGSSLDNGLVAGVSLTNNSGCPTTGGAGECAWGLQNNWSYSSNSLSSADKYDYDYFYNKYFVAFGLGTTFSPKTKMSELAAIGGTGVVLVNNDFEVDTNNTVSVGQFLMVVAKGQITFDSNVTQSAGIFIANSGIGTSGINAAALTINGSLYTPSNVGNIRMNRDFVNQTLNNTNPSVKVIFRPDFIFNMPGLLMKVLSGWKQL